VGVRYFAMVLVALVTAGAPAVADDDPAVMAMLREWSLASRLGRPPSLTMILPSWPC
jgi:hypothetical protein